MPHPDHAQPDPDKLIIAAFARLHQVALGIAVGTVCGLLLFTATVWLVLKGGPVVGPTMALLNQFFPGYSVNSRGAVIGLLYGFALGFVIGWTAAFLRNTLVRLYLLLVKREAELEEASRLLDRW